MKKRSPWAIAHVRLKRLYDERVAPGMTQKEFGKRYGIGSQSMVAQYLNGTRPLNFEAAAKFANALRCTIFDICPEMAEEILPFLGKPLRRAAVLLLCTIALFFTPSGADAASFNITVARIHIAWRRWLVATFGLALSACGSLIDPHTAPPADWPNLAVVEHRVPHEVMRDRCSKYIPWWGYPEACAEWYFSTGHCHIWLSADFPPQNWVIEHELAHCRGYDHYGDSAARDTWNAYKSTAAGRAVANTIKNSPQ